MNSPLLRKLVSAIIAILLFVYLGYQVFNSNHTSVKTEVALAKTEPETIQTTGIAIRKESIMNQAVDGVTTYVVDDGGKVAKGSVVAVTYATSADAAAQEQLKMLDNEISKLQKLGTPGDTYAANPESLNKQINQELTGLLVNFKTSGFSSLTENREKFLYLLNEKQVVSHKAPNFNERIASLQKQRTEIASSHGGQTGRIISPSSSYFISKTDGWESLFNYDNVKNISLQDLQKKVSTDIQTQQTVGKLCANFKWYFACIIPADRAPEFKEGAKLSIDFPFASTSKIPAVVVAVNQKKKEEDAAVILECRDMNSALSLIRKDTAQIQMNDYTGIIVSQRAVHFASVTKKMKNTEGKEQTVSKEVKGVYVLHGSEIQFRQIVPLYSTSSYVICEANPPRQELMTDGTVKLYDEIVVEGTDLYDGKVIK